MITIISPGYVEKLVGYTGTCSGCHCRFECDLTEPKIKDIYVLCPCCKDRRVAVVPVIAHIYYEQPSNNPIEPK
jgi:hypothetical protein